MNTLLLDALSCKNKSRPPVWLMRQAGRHLASYRALRKENTFLQMCHDPKLIAEVTMLPIEAYGVDAAILFSDILVIPEAMGVGLRFEEAIGPIIDRPILHGSAVKDLPSVDHIHRLDFVAEGIKRVLPQLNVPLIGFCGAPFTVASYMVEGKSSRDFKRTKEWMYRDPIGFHALLEKICEWSIAYLRLQIEAGVQAVQIFDSWANTLAYPQFLEFSLPYLRKIVDALKTTTIPVILFCRGSSIFAPALSDLSPAAISFDWNCDLSLVKKTISPSIAIQGNLDPHVLYADLATIEREASYLLDQMEDEEGYIFNLGHGIPPDVSEDAVRTLIQTVKKRETCQVLSQF